MKSRPSVVAWRAADREPGGPRSAGVATESTLYDLRHNNKDCPSSPFYDGDAMGNESKTHNWLPRSCHSSLFLPALVTLPHASCPEPAALLLGRAVGGLSGHSMGQGRVPTVLVFH